jgi:hypothetical protein
MKQIEIRYKNKLIALTILLTGDGIIKYLEDDKEIQLDKYLNNQQFKQELMTACKYLPEESKHIVLMDCAVHQPTGVDDEEDES